MRKLIMYIGMFMAALSVVSCQEEWKDELYEQFASFKAVIGDNGVTDIYIRYKEDGKVTYQLPVIISGSTFNAIDREIHIAVDPDTLATLNDERFGREDLYYQLLGEEHYDFPSTLMIKAGTSVDTLGIDFMLGGVDMVEKWVLPLAIEDDPSYNYVSHPRKNYAKALLRIMPFNDYSGTYSTTTMQVFIKNEDGSYNQEDAIVESTRTAYVVDENTVFFYAGLMDEELIDRRNYKVYFNFDPENHYLSLSTDNEKIKLQPANNNMFAFTVSEQMDATYPYLMHRYVIFNIEYDFVDYTSAPGVEIPYKVAGTMTLERQINTQIPDEDQAIQW